MQNPSCVANTLTSTHRIGVTGASGYIGAALVAKARDTGHEFVAIGRRDVTGSVEFRHADLADPPPAGLLSGLDAVIHLAADTLGDATGYTAELRFATALARNAREQGVRLLVVSSQAASSQAPSAYGRAKAAIEHAVIPLGAACVRPGLVYGGTPRGLFGALVSLVRKLPVIPDFMPRPAVQPIHVDDLVQALLLAVTSCHEPGRIWKVAGPAVSFGEFLAALARFRLRAWRPRVPVPVALVRGLLIAAGRVLGPQFSVSRFDSLLRLPALRAEADLQALGVRLRPLADGLARNGRPERRLLLEGRNLLRAFLGREPDSFATRRYAQAIRARADGRSLSWPAALAERPTWVAAMDTLAFRQAATTGGLAWRYNIAIRIAETRTVCTQAFMHTARNAGWLGLAADLVSAGARELRARLLAPLARCYLPTLR